MRVKLKTLQAGHVRLVLNPINYFFLNYEENFESVVA